MAKKMRLDVAVVERGLASSRERAKAMIMAGRILVEGQIHSKAGDLILLDATIQVRGNQRTYVSRGGLKLQKAMEQYGLCLEQKICMDVGASTGGFTDCMLRSGAKKVYAVDVGYGQLAWKLRTDERVVNLERTNVRYLSAEHVPELVEFASVDVSFISLTLVLPVIARFTNDQAEVICLVKPQFEAGKRNVGKKGVVRDPAIHLEVCQKIYHFCEQLGFYITGATYSPIKGPEGNIEFLFYLKKEGETSGISARQLDQMVGQAHAVLSGGDKRNEEYLHEDDDSKQL